MSSSTDGIVVLPSVGGHGERMVDKETTDTETDTDFRCRVQMIDRLSTALIIMGTISVICGIPTVVLVISIPSIPFIAGSGMWTGALVITVGALGLAMIKEAQNDVTPKLKRLAVAVQVTSIFATHVSFLHLAWSIWGLIACLTNPDPGHGSAAQCNVNTSGIVVQSAYGTLMGLSMSIGCVMTSVYTSGILKVIKTHQQSIIEVIV